MENTIHDIIVPELKDPNYGENLKQQFGLINDNFAKLSNYDFHKGKDGESVQRIDIDLNKISLSYNPIDLNKPSFPKDFGYTVEYIDEDPIEQKILTKLCYFAIANMGYNMKGFNLKINKILNNKLTILTKPFNESKRVEFESLYNQTNKNLINKFLQENILAIIPYFYVDSNYYDDGVKFSEKLEDDKTSMILFDVDVTNYSFENQSSKDISVVPVVALSGLGFTYNSQNIFPNFYYNDTEKTFCWSFGNQKTNLPVQGRDGKNGESGKIYLGLFETNSDGIATITQIYNEADGDYKNIEGVNNYPDNQTCILKFKEFNSGTNGYIIHNEYYYVTSFFKQGNELKAYVSDKNKVQASSGSYDTILGETKNSLFIPDGGNGHVLTNSNEGLDISYKKITKEDSGYNYDDIDNQKSINIKYAITNLNGGNIENVNKISGPGSSNNILKINNMSVGGNSIHGLNWLNGINFDHNNKTIDFAKYNIKSLDALILNTPEANIDSIKTSQISMSADTDSINICDVKFGNDSIDFSGKKLDNLKFCDEVGNQLVMADGGVTSKYPFKFTKGSVSYDNANKHWKFEYTPSIYTGSIDLNSYRTSSYVTIADTTTTPAVAKANYFIYDKLVIVYADFTSSTNKFGIKINGNHITGSNNDMAQKDYKNTKLYNIINAIEKDIKNRYQAGVNLTTPNNPIYDTFAFEGVNNDSNGAVILSVANGALCVKRISDIKDIYGEMHFKFMWVME